MVSDKRILTFEKKASFSASPNMFCTLQLKVTPVTIRTKIRELLDLNSHSPLVSD
jgi:hypothetical protein